MQMQGRERMHQGRKLCGRYRSSATLITSVVFKVYTKITLCLTWKRIDILLVCRRGFVTLGHRDSDEEPRAYSSVY